MEEEKRKLLTKFLQEILKERDHYEYIAVDGRIILKYILQ
jgi:hypothetical protein